MNAEMMNVERRLFDLGFLDQLGAAPEQTRAVLNAVKDFQRFHGLTVDGDPGPVTRRALAAPRFCGHPDVMHMAAANGLAKWPTNNVTWSIQGNLPGITAADFKLVAINAFAAWARVCGLKPTYQSNTRTANILITTGRIDREGGTLAWSELPPPNATSSTTLLQKYDSAENFSAGRPESRFDVWLLPVMTHEIGHAKGIGHLPAGNLLQPFYDPAIWQPQADDIAEAVKRYGPSDVVDDGGDEEDQTPELTTIKIETPHGIMPRIEVAGFRLIPTQ